jgi:dihydroorotate dehydrogenase (fumarate)
MRDLNDGVAAWLDARDYASLEQAKGTMSQVACGNPHAFERAQYVRTLVDYETGVRGKDR